MQLRIIMPVQTMKSWWLLKIEQNAWVGGKGCAVCVDLQAAGSGVLDFFGELYSLAKGFGQFLRGVWAGLIEREVL